MLSHALPRDFLRRVSLLRALSIALLCLGLALAAHAQAGGNSGNITGTVTDPTAAVVPNATVEIHNPVSGYNRSTTTDNAGKFSFPNVPYNHYHVAVSGAGFAPYAQDIDVRSQVTQDLKISLELQASKTEVTVEADAGDLLENQPTFHSDVDRGLFDKLPLESASSSLSSLVTLATPGIAADSNGLFHGLGDHAENSFSLDGQPITDQQSKVFSNQVPLDSVQSMEVIAGAPPAEYGDKTSLVINVTTRSGQGMTTPHGAVTASYGSFGSSLADLSLGYGGKNWGNFIAVNGLNTGRFLDPPEFTVMHAKGNEENVFDRVDYQFSDFDSLHLNLGFTRSWFQNPNSFDQQFHPALSLGPTDQRSQIKTYNLAPSFTHLIGNNAVFTIGGFLRHDQYDYYPSANPLNDLAPDLQAESVSQSRKLTNAGVRSTISYNRGIHNIKAGVVFEHTFLNEGDGIGIVDPTIDPSCSNPITAPFNLTCGGTPFAFHGHADIKQAALYLQDNITKGNWSVNLGIRGDIYRGLSHDNQAEPRAGVAYNVKRTNTILRASYARALETPFNENLVIGSTGCGIPFLATIIPPPGVPCNLGTIRPGYRNEFHAGVEQAFGKYLVVSAESIWKYTHNGYDFGVVGATPVAFPIEWQRSKIPGYAARVSVPNFHGLTALVTMSHVAARFFLPQVAGVPIIPPATGVFRIDHDEVFNQTTHLQYQPWKRGPWFGFNWRYDSGLVSGAIPCVAPTATCFASTPIADGGGAAVASGLVALNNAITGLPLTADQEFQAGLTCNGVLAAPNPLGPALASCPANQLGSIYLQVPPPGKENDDKRPQRIAPRHLFDIALGHDNIFHGDRYQWSARFTVINLANKTALYNFLSTFSGTHYVTPRTLTAEIGFHF